MILTFTTDIPAKTKLYQIDVGDPENFDPKQSQIIDADEPLMLSGDSYDYDQPQNAGDTDDAQYGVYLVHFIADNTGSTSHDIEVDDAATRIVYEMKNGTKRSTTMPNPVVVNPDISGYTSVCLWLSDSDRFPD